MVHKWNAFVSSPNPPLLCAGELTFIHFRNQFNLLLVLTAISLGSTLFMSQANVNFILRLSVYVIFHIQSLYALLQHVDYICGLLHNFVITQAIIYLIKKGVFLVVILIHYNVRILLRLSSRAVFVHVKGSHISQTLQ
jgi:hypothetical protein